MRARRARRLTGIRDEGLLDSALARPLNHTPTASPTWPNSLRPTRRDWRRTTRLSMATSAAFLAMGLFLFANGYRLTATRRSDCDHAPAAGESAKRNSPHGFANIRQNE